jgi:hypothetical protein
MYSSKEVKMKTKLKKCPFCGNNADVGKVIYTWANFLTKHFVGCIGCFCKTNEYRTIKNAILAWNRRSK